MGFEGLGSEPEVRRYELMRSVSEKSIELYVKVSDQYRERVFGVYSLGNVVSFGQPERQVDQLKQSSRPLSKRRAHLSLCNYQTRWPPASPAALGLFRHAPPVETGGSGSD